MAFNVRIFAHEGLSQMQVVLPSQQSENVLLQLTQPYVWSQWLVVGFMAVISRPDLARNVTILRVEVPQGRSIRYEINPPSRNIAAGEQSPILSGHGQFQWGPGWSISIIDAEELP